MRGYFLFLFRFFFNHSCSSLTSLSSPPLSLSLSRFYTQRCPRRHLFLLLFVFLLPLPLLEASPHRHVRRRGPSPDASLRGEGEGARRPARRVSAVRGSAGPSPRARAAAPRARRGGRGARRGREGAREGFFFVFFFIAVFCCCSRRRRRKQLGPRQQQRQQQQQPPPPPPAPPPQPEARPRQGPPRGCRRGPLSGSEGAGCHRRVPGCGSFGGGSHDGAGLGHQSGVVGRQSSDSRQGIRFFFFDLFPLATEGGSLRATPVPASALRRARRGHAKEQIRHGKGGPEAATRSAAGSWWSALGSGIARARRRADEAVRLWCCS